MSLAKKSLGQNFLIDKNIIRKIVSLTKIKDKNIFEIGPGKGAITNEILKYKPKSLSIIEKDTLLAQELKNKYSSFNNIKVLNADILNFNLEKEILENSTIFGNLPYNISSQILVKIIKFKKWPPKFNNLILMFQKELGEKILGKFKTPNYGRLSILTNYRLRKEKDFFVSSNCFSPKPKITSMVIQFKPKKAIKIKINDLNILENITRKIFSNKRKMINKGIKKLLKDEDLKKIENLDLGLRPSELKPEIYYKITKVIEEN